MHHAITLPVPEDTCIRGDCATLFVSLELSRSTWVATSLAPGSRKMSKNTLVGGDGRKLLDLLARLKTRAEQRIAAPVKVVTIHEVGLDGFRIHRLLEANRSARNRGSAPWQYHQARAKRTAVGSRASARSCCKSAFGTRTAFADCCSARGSPTTIRSTRTAGKTWNNCGPGTDAQCQLTSSQRFCARSIGSSWSYAKSARSKPNAMKCCS